MSTAADDETGSGSGSDEPNLNISLESENLNPAEKAAHEADTLPMDAPPPTAASKASKEHAAEEHGDSSTAGVRQKLVDRANALVDPLLVSRNPLPSDASRRDRMYHAVRCPPHGQMARALSLALLPLIAWGVAVAMFGALAAPPNGTLFLLIVLVVTAMILGQAFALLRLPPLLGMLIMGIILNNLPGVDFDKHWQHWSSTLRGIALVIILMRAGLGLDPVALKRLSGMVFRLAFSPCLVETFVVGVAARYLLNFPWLWGFMLGFILAAVSPAVVVPCLLNLQERGYGVAKGIPTLVIAAASVDDVLAISGFTILMGITFKPDADLVAIIFQGPLEAVIGLAFGIGWGLLVILLPHKESVHYEKLRFLFLMGGCLLALFGSKRLEVSGAGALAVLVMAFVAGVGWRKQGWTGDTSPVSEVLANLWVIFQPLLFGLIGTEIRISELDGATISWGLLVVALGLFFRIITSYLAVGCGDLSLRERLFVALAWLPKATVQAAIGPAALDTAVGLAEPKPHFILLGKKVLTIAVLVILITAPIGAIAIMLSGPRLLERQRRNQDDVEAAASEEKRD